MNKGSDSIFKYKFTLNTLTILLVLSYIGALPWLVIGSLVIVRYFQINSQEIIALILGIFCLLIGIFIFIKGKLLLNFIYTINTEQLATLRKKIANREIISILLSLLYAAIASMLYAFIVGGVSGIVVI